MFSLWSSVAFLAFYIFYLLMGSYLFNSIECPEEIKAKSWLAAQKRRFMKLIMEEDIGNLHNACSHMYYYVVHNETTESTITSIINQTIQQLMMEINLNSSHKLQEEDCEMWSFFNSFYFSFTSITTIGYGKMAPRTQLGRGVCLLYSIIGIPINNMLISSIASFFSNKGSGLFLQNFPPYLDNVQG